MGNDPDDIIRRWKITYEPIPTPLTLAFNPQDGKNLKEATRLNKMTPARVLLILYDHIST